MADKVRLGIIGAGNFTQSTILPNLLRIPDVEVAVVCNRTPESAQRVAARFNIPETSTDYREVLKRQDIDGVHVGTQPAFHREAVLAALDAGKHVLCLPRMAENAKDAQEMYQRAKDARANGLKTMLSRPSSFVRGHRFMLHLLESGYVGRVYQVFVFAIQPDFADSKAPLGRRQNLSFGRINPMHVGNYWDILARWFGDPRRVLAQAYAFTPYRPAHPGGPMVEVLPDTVTAIAEMKSGAIVSSVQFWAGHFGENRVEVYGEEGTVIYYQRDHRFLGARTGDKELATLPIPPELEEPWHVEEDFIRAVRGELDQPWPSFLDGLKNVQYMEAVYQSSREGRWVDLP